MSHDFYSHFHNFFILNLGIIGCKFQTTFYKPHIYLSGNVTVKAKYSPRNSPVFVATRSYRDNIECSVRIKGLFSRRYTFFTCFLVKTYSYILNTNLFHSLFLFIHLCCCCFGRSEHLVFVSLNNESNSMRWKEGAKNPPARCLVFPL